VFLIWAFCQSIFTVKQLYINYYCFYKYIFVSPKFMPKVFLEFVSRHNRRYQNYKLDTSQYLIIKGHLGPRKYGFWTWKKNIEMKILWRKKANVALDCIQPMWKITEPIIFLEFVERVSGFLENRIRRQVRVSIHTDILQKKLINLNITRLNRYYTIVEF